MNINANDVLLTLFVLRLHCSVTFSGLLSLNINC